MYTRRTRFPLKPNSSDQAAEIAQKFEQTLHDLPGHVSTVMFVEEDTSVLSITTWDTEEHAQGVNAVRDAAQRDMADILTGAPSTTIGPTLVHDAR